MLSFTYGGTTFKNKNLVEFHSGNRYLYDKAYETVSYGFMRPELIAIWDVESGFYSPGSFKQGLSNEVDQKVRASHLILDDDQCITHVLRKTYPSEVKF